jgi:hypothetical protein
MKAFKRWTNAEATNCLLMVVQPVESQLSEKLAHCEGGAKGVWGGGVAVRWTTGKVEQLPS